AARQPRPATAGGRLQLGAGARGGGGVSRAAAIHLARPGGAHPGRSPRVGAMSAAPVRCAVIPPVPVPYREPLFEGLAAGDALDLRVIYQAARAPGWDAPADWFPRDHSYDALVLRAWQHARADGRTPVAWPRGLERALRERAP